MNKSSSMYLFECYIWLVNTIARGPITLAAINDKWARASVNDYKKDSIPECTFHRWKNCIQLLFDVTIKCNTRGEYYIEDSENLRSENWRNRMFQLFAMNSLIKDSKGLRDRILYEPIPSGEIYLTTVVEAMRDNCVLEMTYQGFAQKEPSTFMVEPYCIKVRKSPMPSAPNARALAASSAVSALARTPSFLNLSTSFMNFLSCSFSLESTVFRAPAYT